MKRKSIGYFEGTDSTVLSTLVCDGMDTIPISNGLDNHGRHVRLINEENKVDVLVGYLHKVYAPVGTETMGEDIFHICQTYQIPFLVVVPKNQHDCAPKVFDEVPDIVQFVDPDHLLKTLHQLLKP